MVGRVLMLLTGLALCYSATVSAQKKYKSDYSSTGYSTTSGAYNEYLIRGYNIQPNRPGVWEDGCRTDNYYCMAALERRRNRESFVEPNIMQGHR